MGVMDGFQFWLGKFLFEMVVFFVILIAYVGFMAWLGRR